MADEPLAPRLERRKRYLRLTPQDCASLRDLRPILEQRSGELVERFYEHLLAWDDLRPFLTQPAVVERLKGFQRDYLLRLTSGRYDDDYAQDRVRIGHTHSRIGLDPEWYLGSYGLYLDLLFPLIFEHAGGDGRDVSRAAALAKVMILDMQLVLDAYHDIQQRRAVEHAAHLAAIGELAASIAHEVRNPLAGMKGALSILRRDLAVPANQEIVDELLIQIERLEQLVRDLLTYARPRPPSRQSFDLHALLDQVLRRHEAQCAEQRVAVDRDYGTGTARLEADPAQMEQIFLNLVQNALQAMPDGGRLTVATRRVEGGIAIRVADTGRGIPPADLPKVEQPFFTTKHRGSGLGLSIVKKIAEAHGGSLRLSSAVDRGTRAEVFVPEVRTD